MRQGGNFVEKERAAVGGFEIADLVADGAGEGAAAIAEEFGFDQGVGDGAAIDGDEGLVARDAVVVDRPGEQFFAGAGFADDDDVALDGGELADRFEELGHGPANCRQGRGRCECCGELLGDDAVAARQFADIPGPAAPSCRTSSNWTGLSR